MGSDRSEDGQCGVCLWIVQYRKRGKSGQLGTKSRLGGDIFLENTSDPLSPQPKVNDNHNQRGDRDQDREGGGGKYMSSFSQPYEPFTRG